MLQKENRSVVVLQTNGSLNVSEKLEQIKEGAENATGYQILLICGDEIHPMQEIPEMFQKCVEKEGDPFFADQMKYAVISWKETPFPGRTELQSTEEVKSTIAEGILSHRRELMPGRNDPLPSNGMFDCLTGEKRTLCSIIVH